MPLRVLFVNPGTFRYGGAERSLLGLLEGLEDHPVAFRILVFGEGDFAELLRQRGYDVGLVRRTDGFRAGARYEGDLGLLRAGAAALPALRETRRAIRAEASAYGADIVHTNGIRAHLATPRLGVSGASVVWSLRDLPRSQWERRALTYLARTAGGVIANSQLVVEEWRLDFRRSWVVDNPVRALPHRSRDSALQALGVPAPDFVVANLSHLHGWKGHLDLLRAFETLDSGARLLLAGGALYGRSSAAYEKELREAVARSPAASRVHLLGVRDDVSWVYGAADVVAHCSTQPEPFGRTIVESLLTATPVVSSIAGTPGRILEHGVTALLYEPGDVAGLAARLHELRRDDRRRRALAEQGRAWAAERFSPARHADAVMEVYRTVRSRRRTGRPRWR